MPGKAKSQTRKARDAQVEHEMLIQQVAQLYAEEQEKPAGERIGLRHVCCTVSEQYHREKGYWVSLAHNTVCLGLLQWANKSLTGSREPVLAHSSSSHPR